MARTFVGFNVDTSEGNALSGFMETLSEEIKTAQHMGPVLKYVHSEMSKEFSLFMAAVAESRIDEFHHVYEWDQVGDINGRLWRDVLVGHGGSRIASFEWRASHKEVPLSAEAEAAGVKGGHVFTWKAPVMEYDTNITIAPKEEGGSLAVFTGPVYTKDDYPVYFTKEEITVQNPGGPNVKGSFTRAYISWWAGAAGAQVFRDRIMNSLDFDDIDFKALKKSSRKRSKVFRLGVAGNTGRATAAGSAAAREYMRKRTERLESRSEGALL